MISPVIILLVLVKLASAVVLRTSGRWILDAATGQRVKLRCVNWAGHQEVNIPEGLQHQSATYISQWLSRNHFNCVRLTFSTDMALNPHQPVADAFVAAAAPAGVSTSQMTSLYHQALTKNPWLSSTTTSGAFARVIQELAAVNVTVILDNHVSRASWCCSLSDGNGWWSDAFGYYPPNSQYFNAKDWIEGLRRMASFAVAHPNVVGIALRNELRAAGLQNINMHRDWYKYMTEGARVVRQANPNLLVVVGGTNFALDLGFIYRRQLDTSVFQDKLVYEFHHYEWSGTERSCEGRKRFMGAGAGYLLVQNQAYTGPLFLSEFGWTQNSPSTAETSYVSCLVDYMKNNDAEWAYWGLQGSYYVRDGDINHDESFGLLNHDWSGWRNNGFLHALGGMFDMTQGP